MGEDVHQSPAREETSELSPQCDDDVNYKKLVMMQQQTVIDGFTMQYFAIQYDTKPLVSVSERRQLLILLLFS